MSYLLMILLISLLVVLHELGHLLVARRCGVKVERFGMGLPFGPTLWSKTIGGVEVCLHAVPFGGYVAFPDDSPDSDVPPDSRQRFENQSIVNRAAIALAGITVNALVAWLLMAFVIGWWGPTQVDVRVLADRPEAVERPLALSETAAMAGVGEAGVLWRGVQHSFFTSQAQALVTLAEFRQGGKVPPLTFVAPEVSAQALVLEPPPATVAGLKPGDTVLSIDGEPVQGYYGQSFDFVISQFAARAGQPTAVTYQRQGQVQTTTVTPSSDGKIGVFLDFNAPEKRVQGLGVWESLRASAQFMNYIVWKNFEGIGMLATGAVPPSMVDGPIGIVAKGGQVIEHQGIEKGLILTAIISMILAVMNLLPIPPLDGSHLIFLGIEAIKGSPVNKVVQERIVQVGFMGLLALMVLVVVNDVAKVFTLGF